jgi:2-octaprenylphenol hydroxylase
MQYDIAVVGAGLAGACAAALLARRGGTRPERIVLLDAQASIAANAVPPGDAPAELRVVALSRASERILEAADAWRRLPAARISPYERMCVWPEVGSVQGAGCLCFDAADVGEPNLGYIVENSWLQRACLASFRDSGGVLQAARVRALAIDESGARLTLEDGATLSARLVIGADGADSAVRGWLGIPVRRHSFGAVGIVANLRTARPHQHTAWQRFLRTGPLALLPMFDGSCSLVWTMVESRAPALLECSDEQFSAQVEAAADRVLGEMRLVGARAGFPLQRLVARDFIAPRCALLGDAAHVIHPLAGQGANLGLLDAEALCQAVSMALRRREDPGALGALRLYERQRLTHNRLMDLATRAFHYGAATPGVPAWMLQRALRRVAGSSTLKRFFAREALGLGMFRPGL